MCSQRKYCGRVFSDVELDGIRHLIASHEGTNRAQLSRLVCEHLGWRRFDGGLKEMSCRVAMLRMQNDGLIVLPPPQKKNGNGKAYKRRTALAEPGLFDISVPVDALSDLRLELIGTRKSSHLWNEYIERYHYLGYQPLPGAQLRYFARAGEQILALLGFGAAAWLTAPRDQFIGWTDERRRERLHLVVNNHRFLILPWVNSRNLASRVLAMAAQQLPEDWRQRYGYSPVLLETFVEIPRFLGTCYKAANWQRLGETTGRGKLEKTQTARLPKKAVWVFPLAQDFRHTLCA
jgi:hypothetical protein